MNSIYENFIGNLLAIIVFSVVVYLFRWSFLCYRNRGLSLRLHRIGFISEEESLTIRELISERDSGYPAHKTTHTNDDFVSYARASNVSNLLARGVLVPYKNNKGLVRLSDSWFKNLRKPNKKMDDMF